MEKTITEWNFINEFERMRPDNFSRAGLIALFDFFGEIESATGQEIELDVVAICRNYSEYESVADIIADYTSYAEYKDEDEDGGQILDEDLILRNLEDRTTVLQFDGGYIIEDF